MMAVPQHLQSRLRGMSLIFATMMAVLFWPEPTAAQLFPCSGDGPRQLMRGDWRMEQFLCLGRA